MFRFFLVQLSGEIAPNNPPIPSTNPLATHPFRVSRRQILAISLARFGEIGLSDLAVSLARIDDLGFSDVTISLDRLGLLCGGHAVWGRCGGMLCGGVMGATDSTFAPKVATRSH